MTDRLKAWCHWMRKENHVSEDTLLMVRDIEALIEVAEAAKEVIRTCGGLPETEVLNEMEKALERLEAVK